jgi:hypothetical protein
MSKTRPIDLVLFFWQFACSESDGIRGNRYRSGILQISAQLSAGVSGDQLNFKTMVQVQQADILVVV